MISGKSSQRRGKINCSPHPRPIALKDNHQKIEMLGSAQVDLNFLEILAKKFTTHARQNQLIRENVSNNDTVRWIGIALNRNCVFIGSFTENFFCYQQFEKRIFGTFRG